VGRDVFCRRVQGVRHRAFLGFRPKAAENIVGSTAKQQIEVVGVSRHDGCSPFGTAMWRRPSAVREATTGIFLRPTGRLNHTVQRDMFENLDLSHAVSLNVAFCSPAAGAVNTIPM